MVIIEHFNYFKINPIGLFILLLFNKNILIKITYKYDFYLFKTP